MATPQTDFLFNGEFDDSDWLEAVNLYAPSQLSVGKQRAVATMTAYIEDFSKLKSCIHWLRGYSWVDENLNLRRVRPARHPIWPNLVCTEILECVGLQFDRKQDITTDDQDLPFAVYKKFKLTASFNSVPYLMADDGDGTEDERWTTFTPKPYVDNYAFPFGEVKYSAPGKAWDDTPIMRDTVLRSQKGLYELKWFEVPILFILDDDGIARKLEAAIGKLNSDTYAGQFPGVWLLDDASVEPYSDPIVGDIAGTTGKMANVTFYMRKWNPTVAVPSDPTRGWNLELAIDGQGYPAYRRDGTSKKFEDVSFASLFTHWSQP